MQTNSAYGGFELSGLEMPKDDLDATSGRIKAETIADYLLLYFERFVKDRVNVSCVASSSFRPVRRCRRRRRWS